MMKKSFFLVLAIAAALVFFVGCEDVVTGTDSTGTTTVSLLADDGFGLESASIPFNNSTSVSSLNNNDINPDSTALFYAPTDLDVLEDGSPSITFTFNENLRSNAIDAIFRLDNTSDTTISTGSINNGIIKVTNTSGITRNIVTTNVSVSGATVTFSFEADTFNVDEKAKVSFGVTSAKGEFYKVFTCFQPQANVKSSVGAVLAHDFSDYYAYAIDNDEIYILDKGDSSSHTGQATDNESIDGTTIGAGANFGGHINSLSLRATNATSNSSSSVYQHLENLKADSVAVGGTNGSIVNLPMTFDLAENATYYEIYRHYTGTDGESHYGTVSKGTIAALTEDFCSIAPTISGINSINGTEDYYRVVPCNSRGEFDQFSGKYMLVDTVRPYAYTQVTADIDVDTDVISPITWDGDNTYADHDHAPAGAGHLKHMGTFSVYDPSVLDGASASTGKWYANEALIITLNSVSQLVNTADAGVPNGGKLAFSNGAAILTADVADDGFGLDADDYTILSNNAQDVWVAFDGENVKVYAGYICNDAGSGVDYSNIDWTVTGNFSFTMTDLSGNNLLFCLDSNNASLGNGTMTIKLQ